MTFRLRMPGRRKDEYPMSNTEYPMMKEEIEFPLFLKRDQGGFSDKAEWVYAEGKHNCRQRFVTSLGGQFSLPNGIN